MIGTLLRDLRYAGRTFRRSPGFLALAVLTISVGVGANAAIFSIVNAVLLRPLPFPRAGDLVLVSNQNRSTKQSSFDASPANFLDWRRRQHSFTGMAAFREETFGLFSADRPERTPGAVVTVNFFDVLGATPALGRAFQPADEQPGAPRVAVLSDRLWRRQFFARPDAIGQTLRINDEPHTIIGVMAPGIDYPGKAALWIQSHWRVPEDPLTPTVDPVGQRDHAFITVMARLKPGTSLAGSRADMDAIAATLEHDFPDENDNLGAVVLPLRDDLVADLKPTILLLFAAVGLLLLIAAANVSGLLIARATARHQEIAIRIALGASRAQILTQLLTESLVLSVIGGAGGVLLAMWLIGPLVALSPADLTVAGAVTIDRTVLGFGLAVSTVAGVLFGLAPARQLLQTNLHEDLKQGARGGSSPGQRRIRAAIVAGEVALSLVLLIGAGLTIRSFVKLQQQSPGFEPDGVLTMSVSLPAARYPAPGLKAAFWETAIARLRQIPGVQYASATSRLPLLPGNSTRGLSIPGLPPDAQPSASYRTASPDYFRAMRIPLLRGRFFEDGDREGRPLVAIVSASAAQRFWPGRDPIGQHFSIHEPTITVVGVVADIHAAALDTPAVPTIYAPYRQDAWPFMVFAIRLADPGRGRTGALEAPGNLQASVRNAIWSIDKDQPIGAVKTMDEWLSNSLTRRRFSVTLLSVFGAVAVSLAAIGLYGVLAFIVAQRRREIGVRMALGAQPRDVILDVLGQGLRLAIIGIVIGLALALALTRLLNSLLFATSPTDALTFAIVSTLLVAIAIAASLIPALRASRVDPLAALRDE
jgi:putative ABC transport system permease protein